MCTKKMCYGDSAYAYKKSSESPAESRAWIGTHCTPLVMSLASVHTKKKQLTGGRSHVTEFLFQTGNNVILKARH